MTEETEVSPEIKAKAIEMGWQDKPDFPGNPEKWIPADQYVERGEHLLPILHATNKRLKAEVESVKKQVTDVTTALRESQETIAALETYHDQELKRKVEEARKNLRAELAAATSRGDHEAAATITEEMTTLNAEEQIEKKRRDDEEAARKAAANRPKDPSKDPNFIAWKGDNAWYGQDMVRTSIANTLSWKLRDPTYEGHVSDSITGRAYLDEVSKAVEKEMAKLTGGRPSGNGSDKVEGGGTRSGGAGGGTKGKTYADLPPEAKQACAEFEKTLVGPNKPYKTIADWRKKYAERHFA